MPTDDERSDLIHAFVDEWGYGDPAANADFRAAILELVGTLLDSPSFGSTKADAVLVEKPLRRKFKFDRTEEGP